MPAETGRIEHPAGVVFLRPAGWDEQGTTIGTAFAVGAECRTAVVVDRMPPSDSGPGPSVEQSAVQVCAQATDGRSLDTYLQDTYGVGIPGFSKATLGGHDAYRTGEEPNWVFFVQTDRARFQIVTGVAAPADLEATRIAQVVEILASFDFS